MGNHDASGCVVLTITIWPDSVDVEKKVHNRDSTSRIKITCGLVKKKNFRLI
jgi:hypothetical protein